MWWVFTHNKLQKRGFIINFFSELNLCTTHRCHTIDFIDNRVIKPHDECFIYHVFILINRRIAAFFPFFPCVLSFIRSNRSLRLSFMQSNLSCKVEMEDRSIIHFIAVTVWLPNSKSNMDFIFNRVAQQWKSRRILKSNISWSCHSKVILAMEAELQLHFHLYFSLMLYYNSF